MPDPEVAAVAKRRQFSPAYERRIVRAAEVCKAPGEVGADTSGMLDIKFPFPMSDVYVAFDVFYPANFLAAGFSDSNGWKMFILGQGDEGCARFEIVGVNVYILGYPRFYYMCHVFEGVEIQDPFGENLSEFDYQPGGDSQCLRHGANALYPCANFVADTCVTYQVHVSVGAKWLEVWQTVNGDTQKDHRFSAQQASGCPDPLRVDRADTLPDRKTRERITPRPPPLVSPGDRIRGADHRPRPGCHSVVSTATGAVFGWRTCSSDSLATHWP